MKKLAIRSALMTSLAATLLIVPSLARRSGSRTGLPADPRSGAEGIFEPLAPEGVRGLPHQSLAQFQASLPPVSPARTTIYILPLGWPAAERPRLLEMLGEHLARYFGCPSRVLAPEKLGLAGISSRHHPQEGNLQLYTKDVLAKLKARLPSDAICLMAITALDLYPEPGWNFVFADSSPADRVSVMSLARYHPAGPNAAMGAARPRSDTGNPLSMTSWLTSEPVLARDPAHTTPDQLAVLRALKVTTSQVGRVLGLLPCIEYRCAMNWTNSMPELDDRPLHACPSCLAKLESALGFDRAARDRNLVAHYQGLGLAREASWQAACSARSRGPGR